MAVLRRTSGVTVDTNRRAVGVMLGFSEDGFFTAIPVDESVHCHMPLGCCLGEQLGVAR